MTPARDAGGAATEAMIEAAARELDPAIFRDIPHFFSAIGGTLEDHRNAVRRRAKGILDTALAQSAARPGEAVAGEVEAARQWCASVQAELESRDAALCESQAALTVAREGQAASERALAGARDEAFAEAADKAQQRVDLIRNGDHPPQVRDAILQALPDAIRELAPTATQRPDAPGQRPAPAADTGGAA